MVEKEFHRKMFAAILFVTVGGIVLVSSIVYLLAAEEVERTFFSIHQGVRNTWQALFPAVAIGSGVTLILSSLVIYYLTLLHAHRFGGPIYRIIETARKVARGESEEEFHLRRDDYFHDLADALQEMVGEYQGRLALIQEKVKRLESCLAGNAGNEKGASFSDEAVKLLEELKELSSRPGKR
ncbi:MAG: hypothetical protein D6713_05040 [Deltaproteobacteria bacterium]|nr:MAG: hypothetical protein D6713_05040 [Deltaproteobacteria bacterium]